MFGLGHWEIILILVIVLIVFGAGKLPKVAGELAKGIKSFKQGLKDEKKNDNKLYSSGPYWKYKNKKTISEIKKEGLKDFRGISSGIGTSFTDNLVLDIGNELNFRGRLVRKIFSLPVLRIIFKLQIRLTKNYMEDYLKNKSLVFKKDKNVLDLIRKYKFENTTDFGCVEKFNILDKEYELDPKINCFVGDNGVGKTNILDAVYHLSMGKSYFNVKNDQLINRGKDYMLVDGVFELST